MSLTGPTTSDRGGSPTAADRVPLWVPADSPWRDGRPLPALTAVEAVSQLLWRVFGPTVPHLVSGVLGWVDGETPADQAGRPWTPSQLTYRLRAVRRAGRRTPLSPSAAEELLAGVDVAARRRRRLFALPEPRPQPTEPAARIGHWLRSNTASALRLLAAVGPLHIDDITAGVARTHAQRDSAVPTAADLVRGLRFKGAVYDEDTDTWSAPPGTEPADRDARLLAASRPGEVYRRSEAAQMLVGAGYSRHTALNVVRCR